MVSLIFSMTKSILFARNMYLIRGFPRKRLKYPPNLGLPEKSLLKWSIEISFIPNYLKVNNQILTFIISIRNLEIGFVKDLKDSKSSYFNQYFSLNKYNMQKLWSGIRSIINVGKCKNSYITSILSNNKSVDNPNDIANIFNSFFANVGKTTEKGIPQGSHSPLFYLRGNYSGSIFYPLSLHMKFKLLLVRWMLASLVALKVYLLPFWKLLGTIYPSLLHF